MINYWQSLPYFLNPIILNLKFIQIRWYSLLYLSGILLTYFLFIQYCKKNKFFKYHEYSLELLLFSLLGILIGSRLGYVFFYQPEYYFTHPLEIISPFINGEFIGIRGLSYHGGALGLLVAVIIFCKKFKFNFYHFFNTLILYLPLGYFLRRIGNFMNLELFGKPTNLFFGMYFPSDPQHLLRYPSQLFEALGEGLLIFVILLLANKNDKTKNFLTPIYIFAYALIRFLLEFIREPDEFQIKIFGFISYGQSLSIIMLIFGIILYQIFKKKQISYET